MKRIYLLGVGNNTPVFIDLAEQCGYQVAGLYHYNEDRNGESVHGLAILSSFGELLTKGDLSGNNFLLTMGDNLIRADVADKIRARGGTVPSVIHPTAVISRFASIGEGVSISAFSYVQANSRIGRDTIILSGVNISHNNVVGKCCFIAGGSTIGAYTTLGDFVFIGQGVLTVSEKVKYIGSRAYVGAGSLITRSVGQNIRVMGRPARPIEAKKR